MAAYTTIDDPEAHFQVQLYTGNGSANHAITLGADTDMQPDIVWIKNRDATDNHCLFDAVRGVTKVIHPNIESGGEEATDTLDSFTSDGFQVDADVKVNTNAEKYVAWCWKESATSGFDILEYEGNNTARTISHNLSAKPHFIVTKTHDWTTLQNWVVQHAYPGSTHYYYLSQEYGATDEVGMWGDVEPTTSVFSLGVFNDPNKDGQNYITYLWAPVQGFSKFGSYEGNGNADGTFVYTGFRPALVITKSADSYSSWHMFDNKREGYNVDNDALVANDTTVEATADQIDLLSNGFKCRVATDPNVAETFVYLAFAEAPFVNSNGVPCNAR
jgi:hypothetical protein